MKISNPRTAVGISHYIGIYYKEIKDALKNHEDKEELLTYYENINIEQTCFILAFINTVIPIEMGLLKNGFEIYLDSLISKMTFDEDSLSDVQGHLLRIIEGLWIETSRLFILPRYGAIFSPKLHESDDNNAYFYLLRRRFITALVSNKNELKDIVNSYSSYENEVFSHIDNNNLSVFFTNYPEKTCHDIFDTIFINSPLLISSYPNKVLEFFSKVLNYLFEDNNTKMRSCSKFITINCRNKKKTKNEVNYGLDKFKMPILRKRRCK